MFQRIEAISEKKLVGKHLRMSLTHDRTFELWRGFMPHRNEIMHRSSADLVCLQVFDADFDFGALNPLQDFEKWAAVEITEVEQIPDGMELFVLPKGLYAIFLHKGTPADAAKTFDFIFRSWLPACTYEIDERPHFQVMGDKYIHNHPDSEEEVWIPVRFRKS